MNELGLTLRRIREDCSLSLKEVCEELKPEVSVSIDFLSKVEKGFRRPSLQLIVGLSKVYKLPSLEDFYYEVELYELFSEHPNPKKLLRKVLKNWDNSPNFDITSPRSKWGLLPEKDLRKYVRGGRNGKVKGFDYYLNEKCEMTPKQRRTLIQKSKDWMSPSELDSSNTDLEIVECWNEFYDKLGHSIPEFKEKWEREFLPSEELKKEKSKSKKETVSNKETKSNKELLSRFTTPEKDVRHLG